MTLLWHAPVPRALMTAARASRKVRPDWSGLRVRSLPSCWLPWPSSGPRGWAHATTTFGRIAHAYFIEGYFTSLLRNDLGVFNARKPTRCDVLHFRPKFLCC